VIVSTKKGATPLGMTSYFYSPSAALQFILHTALIPVRLNLSEKETADFHLDCHIFFNAQQDPFAHRFNR
jgi:hypothetical protein